MPSSSSPPAPKVGTQWLYSSIASFLPAPFTINIQERRRRGERGGSEKGLGVDKLEVVVSLPPSTPVTWEQQGGGAGPPPAPGPGSHLLPVLWSTLVAEVVVTVFHFAESLLRLKKGNEPLRNTNPF